MSEAFEDKVIRLRAMCAYGQQTWDLSPCDIDAISMAVKAVDAIVKIKQMIMHDRGEDTLTEVWNLIDGGIR